MTKYPYPKGNSHTISFCYVCNKQRSWTDGLCDHCDWRWRKYKQ